MNVTIKKEEKIAVKILEIEQMKKYRKIWMGKKELEIPRIINSIPEDTCVGIWDSVLVRHTGIYG